MINVLASNQGKVSPHWLRHAHASHSLERGAPIHLVQATLEHASIATTSRTCTPDQITAADCTYLLKCELASA